MTTVLSLSRLGILHISSQLGVSNTCKRFQTTLSDAFKILGVDSGCSREEARDAFITSAKKFHPDSGSLKADGTKFAEFSSAYKLVITNIKAKENVNVPDLIEDEFSIEEILKETIPIAHRKYLTNDGIGYGTPSQRQRQYQAYRMNRANTMVSDYKIQKVQRETEGSNMLTVKEFAKRSKTSHFVDRVVEDLIQESMAKGEFNDLKGGKIERPTLPYVDHHDFHLNKVLINSGYTPEWVQSKQEIERELKKCKESLLRERKRFHEPPHSVVSRERWKDKRQEFVQTIDAINKEIQVFNLITPLPKMQMLLLCHEKQFKIVEKMFEEYLSSEDCKKDELEKVSQSDIKNPLLTAIKKFLSF